VFDAISLVTNIKKNLAELPTAVVFHTSVDFGFAHIDKKIEDVQPLLMNKVKELFPDWPEPSVIKCHKWRYSQVKELVQGMLRINFSS
jgi:predicted NAD/FAD-dependent oxidoreductase